MTLSALLIVYLIIIALAVVYALINLFHIFRHGHFDAKSYFVTGIFMAGFLLILGISASFLFTVDWAATIELNLFGSTTNQNLNNPGTQF